ncbi:MAG: NAD(P)/FAD-dependent oxidoreductase [Chloroflexota bacterium]|nr:NAD(P)/FAD-dependent oxidoreductase [Chloroflexota bacterium]
MNAARELEKADVDVLVLDRNNYHGFWPLLYQVATAALEPESIAYPVRAIFRKYRNIYFRLADVQKVDPSKQLVYTDGPAISYDYLILAAGSTNNYFDNTSLAENTLGLKDIDEAGRLRNRILLAFEKAANEPDPRKRRALLTFVLIGGGPTGVELAGAISELIHFVLSKDHPRLDVTESRIVLVESMDHLLTAFPEPLRNSAAKKLAQMSVEVLLSSPVDMVDNNRVHLKDGSVIEAHTVVWAAGVRAAELAEHMDAELARGFRVKVASALNLPGHPELFVVGDMAYLEGYKDEQAYPMVAQVAIQQGKQAARNILSQMAGRPMKTFRYHDLGSMATIGRRSAVMDAFGLRLTGRLAWFGWLFVHIIYLIGFRNRLLVLTNWAFNYFSYERGVRLITSDDDRYRT